MLNENNQAVIRLGDTTTHGGTVISASSTMVVYGIGVALEDDMTRCPQCNGDFAILPSGTGRKHMGRWVAYEGTATACGATLISNWKSLPAADSSSLTWPITIKEPEHTDAFDQRFQLMDDHTGVPLAMQPYQLEVDGVIHRGITDANGYTQVLPTGPTGKSVVCTVLGESLNVE